MSGPNLSLGKPPQTLQKKLSLSRGWLAAIVLLNLAVLACLVVLVLRPAHSGAAPASGGSSQELKAVAAELEDKSLEAEAAHAWENYLAADPQCADRAAILYRIGRLYMQAEQFGPAAAALVRADRAAENDRDLQGKIGPQIVQCLNRLGRYGELGRELSRQVEVGGKQQADDASKKVLATVTGEAFTQADLDRLIERRVDHMLAIQGGEDPQQRAALLQQSSTPAMRRQLLQQLLQTELFARRARELGIDREESFRQARDELIQNLLAERFLMRELEKIKPTAVDLDSYFKANLSQYEVPESLQVLVLRLEEKEDPGALLAKIHSADDFRQVAAGRPSAADPKAEGRPVTRGRLDPELGDVEPLFDLTEGQWTKQPHLHGKDRFLVLIQHKAPRQTPRIEDVLPQVRADYSARKQQELAEKLFADLTQRYAVRILPEATEKPAAHGDAKAEKKAPPTP